MARDTGFHGAMSFVAFSAGYEPPAPISVDEQDAQLQHQFIEAVGKLENIQKQLQRVQQLRRAA